MALYMKAASHKILTFSVLVIFLVSVFGQSFDEKGKLLQSLNMKMSLSNTLGFFCSTVSFGCSTNSMILFQNMAILLLKFLSLYEFHRFPRFYVDDYSSPG